MKNLALSVAVALSSFLSKPAFAKEIYLDCVTDKYLEISGRKTTRLYNVFISMGYQNPRVWHNFFKAEERDFFGNDKNYPKLRYFSLPSMKPKVVFEEFMVFFEPTSNTPGFGIDRISLALIFDDKKNGGNCYLVDESAFKDQVNWTRKADKKVFEAMIEKLNAETKEKYDAYIEKLSKRKF